MTALDPIALAAEARRLAESASHVVIDHDEDCPHRYCADTPCEDPHAEGCEAGLGLAFVPCTCDADRQSLLALIPALADAVEALTGERDRLRDSSRESLALVVQWHERAEDAEADRDRLAAELVEARAETARAVVAEREACATVVDSVPDGDDVSLDGLAAAIRARGGS